jgi:hypothetical protein
MTPQHKNQYNKPKLFEGLRSGDLVDMVSPTFSLDQFKSKMGKDKDVVVMSFKVKEKLPATDLMEFIEKGYQFALDADMSTGEERDGQYSVFVELERNQDVPRQIMEILNGVGLLCDCQDWNFRYFKDMNLYDATEHTLSQHLPLTEVDYSNKMLTLKQEKVNEFFNQGAIDSADIDEANNLVIHKPYAETLNLKLLAMGEYSAIKEGIQGGIQLDDNSRNETVYLEKYLGNYEIHKLDNKFLIKNGDSAIIVQKEGW